MAPQPLDRGTFLLSMRRSSPTATPLELIDVLNSNAAVPNNAITLTGSQQTVYLTLTVGVNRNTNTGQQVRVFSNGITELFRAQSSVDQSTSHDTLSTSRLVQFNSDATLTVDPSASLVLGQPLSSFFSGFSLNTYFQSPLVTFSYVGTSLGNPIGRLIFNGNQLNSIPREGIYFITLTTTVSSNVGIDLRLFACNRLFPLRRIPNVFPELETMQVSALVNCTSQATLLVERTNLETIQDANLFGFLYNPLNTRAFWALNLIGTTITGAGNNRVNVDFSAPTGPLGFTQNVGLPVGAGQGSVRIQTSGRYMLHMLAYFLPGPGIDVQIEVARRSGANTGSPLGVPFQILRVLTVQRPLNNPLMDTISRTGVVELAADDEVRVTLGTGTLLVNSMFSGMLLTPLVTVQI